MLPEDDDRGGRSISNHSRAENGNAQMEDSPELLRWRADVLMDEMMLGGVDLAAGAGESGSGPSQGTSFGPTDFSYASTQTAPPHSSAGPQVLLSSELAHRAGAGSQDTYRHDSQSGANRPERPDLYAVEAQSPFPIGSEAAVADGADSLLRPPSAQMVANSQPAMAPSLGPVIRSGVGGAAAVGGVSGGARQANLLPRASAGNVQTMQHQLSTLRNEVEVTLPVGHEWSERASHLLDKADAILRDAPERTAEVEYYLQQVRSILDRTRESLVWSQTYYKRLTIYLVAWLLLSIVGIVATILYPVSLGTAIAGLFNLPATHVGAVHAGALLDTLFAGTLGGALGALVNMRRHREVEHGFFDRKYSLRGLMLPLIGAFFGLFLYILFGTVYYFADVNPSVNPLAALAPAVLAFIFGFSQESVYGTRD